MDCYTIRYGYGDMTDEYVGLIDVIHVRINKGLNVESEGWLARHSGLVFLALTVFTFLQLGFHASNCFYSQPSSPTSSSSSSWWWTSLTSSSPYGPPVLKTHPIPQLIEDTESAYKKKLSKPSWMLKDAVAEYRKRYGRMPPKGFDKWFEMAMENKVVMIDEYDGMMSDLEPFWVLSGLEVRRRAFQVGSLLSIDVRVRDGKAKTVNLNKGFEDSEVGAGAAGFRGKVAHLLPDLDFSINAKVESRVIVPWEHIQRLNKTLP
ncbi:hypothetical protein VKT23_014385 [Stygiomarasmius scandens]|uniref:Uncharacterized protein n=1 Tax=Marasmiellus scandens TaxID=2682957 RepID=A0ABR1J1V7_9AGAR